jgi:hypothetical protein
VTKEVEGVIADREASHGDWNAQAYAAQSLKAIIRQRAKNLSAHQLEALEMIATKVSRILIGNPNTPDHWTDIAGYAILARDQSGKD